MPSPDAPTRRLAVASLSQNPSEQARAALIASLADADDGVREEAIKGLISRNERETVEDLERLIVEAADHKVALVGVPATRTAPPSRTHVMAALRVLASLGKLERSALSCIKSQDTSIVALVIEALNGCAERWAVEAVLQAARHSHTHIRAAAFRWLGRHQCVHALELL